jgi:transposase
MRRIKEVLRLRFEAGLGHRQIARSCSLGVGTVHDYLKRAEAAGLKWPLPEGWNDERIEAALLVGGRPDRQARRPLPDFKNIREQLQRHSHLTLQLIWTEYREHDPGGYSYSQFCELYQRWRAKQDVVLRQDHKAGERLFVDWAGATIPVHNAETGEVWQAPLFVAVLGARGCNANCVNGGAFNHIPSATSGLRRSPNITPS